MLPIMAARHLRESCDGVNRILEKADTFWHPYKVMIYWLNMLMPHIPSLNPFKVQAPSNSSLLVKTQLSRMLQSGQKLNDVNLDTSGSAKRYLLGISKKLGLDFQQNIYATNIYKNFFITPPTQISEINIFKAFLRVASPTKR